MAASKENESTEAKPRRRTKPVETKFALRNLRHVPATIRYKVDRDYKKEIKLSRRGERGDAQMVSKEDLENPGLMGDHNLIFEVITEAEYKDVVAKQTYNQQAPFHPAHNALRTENDKKYENIRNKSLEEVKGITVGQATDAEHVSDHHWRNNADGGITRGMVPHAEVKGTVDNPWEQNEGQVIQDATSAHSDNIARPGLEGFTVK